MAAACRTKWISPLYTVLLQPPYTWAKWCSFLHLGAEGCDPRYPSSSGYLIYSSATSKDVLYNFILHKSYQLVSQGEGSHLQGWKRLEDG